MTRVLMGLASGLFGIDVETDSAPRALLRGVQARALAVDPSEPARVYCATYNRGLWRSEDAGDTWLPVGTPQDFQAPSTPGAIGPRETTAVSVERQPQADGRHAVWVGTELSSLYRSIDHGETFEFVSPLEMPSRSTWAFPPRPETHHVHCIANDANGGVHVAIEFGAMLRSRDGVAFDDRRPDSPLDTHVLLTHEAAPGRLYAALGDGLMKRGRSFGESRDNGDSWRYLGDGMERAPYLYGLAINPGNPDDMLVAASRGPQPAHVTGGSSIYRRNGDRWIEEADGFPGARSLIPALASDPERPDTWFALSDLGLFVKGPSSTRWTRLAADDAWRGIHPMSLAVIDI